MATTTIRIPFNPEDYTLMALSHVLVENIKNPSADSKFKITFKEGATLVLKQYEIKSVGFHFRNSDDSEEPDNYIVKYLIDLIKEPITVNYGTLQCTISTEEPKEIVPVKSICRDMYQFGILVITLDTKDISAYDAMISDVYKIYDAYKKNINKNDLYTTLYLPDAEYWQSSQHITKRKMESVFLPAEDKASICDDLKSFISSKTRDIYERLCITYKRIYLFAGIPGAGKTSFIKALAGSIGYNLAIMNFSPKLDDSGLMRLVLNLPEKTILLMEDMDCLFQSRKAHDTDTNIITLSGMLNTFDGIGTKHGLICFITTNFKSHLDPALIRPGRVDKILTFDYATKEQMETLFKFYMWEIAESEIDQHFKVFYKNIIDLRIKISVSLLTQYLFAYYNQPLEAITNYEKMRDYYKDSKIVKNAEDGDMYS
jgi:hypothetical protein